MDLPSANVLCVQTSTQRSAGPSHKIGQHVFWAEQVFHRVRPDRGDDAVLLDTLSAAVQHVHRLPHATDG